MPSATKPKGFISPSDLKTILHSKRANIYYLEHCRVLVKNGRVEYVTDRDRKSLYWNIPIANTTTVMLGKGTSVTQAAMQEFAKAGVLVGFCGNGGTPLYSANEFDVEVSWFSPQSEYRPTQYLQGWIRFWLDDAARLDAAKRLQLLRLQFLYSQWPRREMRDYGFVIDKDHLKKVVEHSTHKVMDAPSAEILLTEEGRLTKILYKLAARATHYGQFTRAKRGEGIDLANRFLDHGNYLAYGLGATATWVLGLPHGLSVLHGKTRRGGLVFDTADLVKDALILPQAFLRAMKGDTDQEFRQTCIENLLHAEALDFMIDSLKEISEKTVIKPAKVQ